ncbi:glycerol-3-phosphate 1-O-acyltransferase PlsY [soil metagenome]
MMFWLLVVGGFFLGSIPFGYLIAKSKGIDIRSVGSGNIGATNVKRILGPKWGWIVFGLDLLKGLIPSLLGTFLLKDRLYDLDPQTQAFIAGLAAVLGHAKSPFLGFKGGKGVSTAMGAGLGAVPLVAIIAFTLFAIITWITRYLSLGSVLAIGLTPVLAWLLPGNSPQVIVPLTLLAVAVVWLHRANLKRLARGEESKFSLGGKKSDPGTPRPSGGEGQG